MPLEYQFALEISFRALEPSVMTHLTRIIVDNPGWDSKGHTLALEAILWEQYPPGYLEWFNKRLAAILP